MLLFGTDNPIEAGSRVKSRAVGKRAAFSGTVETRFSSSTWHVRADDDGGLWHRSSSELTSIENEGTA